MWFSFLFPGMLWQQEQEQTKAAVAVCLSCIRAVRKTHMLVFVSVSRSVLEANWNENRSSSTSSSEIKPGSSSNTTSLDPAVTLSPDCQLLGWVEECPFRFKQALVKRPPKCEGSDECWLKNTAHNAHVWFQQVNSGVWLWREVNETGWERIQFAQCICQCFSKVATATHGLTAKYRGGPVSLPIILPIAVPSFPTISSGTHMTPSLHPGSR